MPKIIAYLRTSTDQQCLDSQRTIIWSYCKQNNINIDEFIEISISSRRSWYDRKIEELIDKLEIGDKLIVTELSRLGRNMKEILNLMEVLNKMQIQTIFISQPELSTDNEFADLLFAIYGYFSQCSRNLTSERTKAALQALKAKGVRLGRKPGAIITSKYEQYRDKIEELDKLGVTKKRILAHLQNEMGWKDCSYPGLCRFMAKKTPLTKLESKKSQAN